jgi:hypothetical protein
MTHGKYILSALAPFDSAYAECFDIRMRAANDPCEDGMGLDGRGRRKASEARATAIEVKLERLQRMEQETSNVAQVLRLLVALANSKESESASVGGVDDDIGPFPFKAHKAAAAEEEEDERNGFIGEQDCFDVALRGENSVRCRPYPHFSHSQFRLEDHFAAARKGDPSSVRMTANRYDVPDVAVFRLAPGQDLRMLCGGGGARQDFNFRKVR